MSLETLGRARYVSLTTYRRNGTAVPTPVWAAPDGGELLVISKNDAGKVKRLRNDGRVEVVVCDLRGRIEEGAVRAQGTARLLDDAELPRVRKALARKYGWQFWMSDAPIRLLRGGKRPHTAISVRLKADAGTALGQD
ncbi:PPOX class F420-dependent oxidoreductase [Streptomyces triticagri]|uniref:PPOX class F420-dependent oxidoreductase n=1 Tax=Streptomyces triticagri TaxID=2293568 RepID=A0A372M7Q3_9ACTN|nr:PPOX class F420-dependent oxidoreductase [Streptomyces triticagri]RFU86535.1 PPOX class F420-dependent oxidoreductase [Streptomyces triticagri]